MKRLALLLIALPLCALAQRPEIHCKHFVYGYPYGAPASNDLIFRDIYVLSNNDDTKFADWVCYRLTQYEVTGASEEDRNWKADPFLADNETLEPDDDYKGAYRALDTDRGHQAPLASFKGTPWAEETNYFSNITPQKNDLNRGPWKKLEDRVRDLVLFDKSRPVWVMTGTLYEADMPKLPNSDEPHKIPSGYWKIVCADEGGELHVAGFLFYQSDGRDVQMLDRQVSIDEIEARAKLDFFWELPDREEDRLEEGIDVKWGQKHFQD